MGFAGGGRGGGPKKPKQSKVGSKVRRANKKAKEAGPREAEMLVPAGGVRKGSGSAGKDATGNTSEPVALESVDWDKIGNWQKVKYDPNRLIFGAQEEGFVELEEIDMKDLGDLSRFVSGGGAGGKSKNGTMGKQSEEASPLETVSLDYFADHDGDFDEDDPAHFPPSDDEEGKAPKVKKAKKEKEAKKSASNPDSEQTVSTKPKSLSAKDARIEKRKARWKQKVEAAKARKAEARAALTLEKKELGTKGTKMYTNVSTQGTFASEDDDVMDRVSSGRQTQTTADPTGDSKREGWHMDYNNYPTSGMGAVVDGVDLDTGTDVSNWLQFDLHPKLLRALQVLGFSDPTPIQMECLNPAIKGRCDLIGAAETGSGKTLAFGIPILHRLLTQMDIEAEDSESSEEDVAEEKETEADGDDNNKSDSDDPFANIIDESGRSGKGAGFTLSKRRKALRALIVAPTRELAMQVCDMLVALAKHAPEIAIVSVVGGMSLQKQERLLSKRPEIVVATPGRLWELMNNQGHEHFLDLGRLNFLVLDEADRMVERGHFQELHNIIDTLPMPQRVKRPPGAAKATPETLKVFKKRTGPTLDDGEDNKNSKDGERGGRGRKGGNAEVMDVDIVDDEELLTQRNPNGVEISLRPSQMLDRQTFVFSATLTVPDSVRRKLKRGQAMGKQSNSKTNASSNEGSLSSLMEQVPFYGRVKLCDLTDQNGTVAKRVMESALECTEDERDALLYHILTQQPGLVIVFVNAISALRRLLSLLKILQLPVEGLHGNMQQRQRLKYLDRFRNAALTEGNNESRKDSLSADTSVSTRTANTRISVLVATDVAARGIDIKGIDLVVHYQVPQSADTYVHRSGRTGRAMSEGASVVLVTPGERTRYRALLRALNRGDSPLPAFPTVETAVAEARRRLSLAKRLDKITHTKQKDTADAEWRKTNAAELGIELDSDEDADLDAKLVFQQADKKAKTAINAKAKRAFDKAKRRAEKGGKGDANGSDSDSDSSDSDSSDEDPNDTRMAELVESGFDQDDQTSLGRLGEHRRLGREEAKLRYDLGELLKTPLGVKAERRKGVASARYPSRGDGAVRLAEQARSSRNTAGKDGSSAVAAVDMLRPHGGRKTAAAAGATAGGAAGKRKRVKK